MAIAHSCSGLLASVAELHRDGIIDNAQRAALKRLVLQHYCTAGVDAAWQAYARTRDAADLRDTLVRILETAGSGVAGAAYDAGAYAAPKLTAAATTTTPTPSFPVKSPPPVTPAPTGSPTGFEPPKARASSHTYLFSDVTTLEELTGQALVIGDNDPLYPLNSTTAAATAQLIRAAPRGQNLAIATRVRHFDFKGKTVEFVAVVPGKMAAALTKQLAAAARNAQSDAKARYGLNPSELRPPRVLAVLSRPAWLQLCESSIGADVTQAVLRLPPAAAAAAVSGATSSVRGVCSVNVHEWTVVGPLRPAAAAAPSAGAAAASAAAAAGAVALAVTSSTPVVFTAPADKTVRAFRLICGPDPTVPLLVRVYLRGEGGPVVLPTDESYVGFVTGERPIERVELALGPGASADSQLLTTVTEFEFAAGAETRRLRPLDRLALPYAGAGAGATPQRATASASASASEGKLEAMQRGFADSLSLSRGWAKTFQERADAVCFMVSDTMVATGFMVSERLLMTNRHVLKSETNAARFSVIFGYGEKALGEAKEQEFASAATRQTGGTMPDCDDWAAELWPAIAAANKAGAKQWFTDPDTFCFIAPDHIDVDMGLVAVSSVPARNYRHPTPAPAPDAKDAAVAAAAVAAAAVPFVGPVAADKVIRLNRYPELRHAEVVNLISHPAALAQRVSMGIFTNYLHPTNGKFEYTTDSVSGSSGAPVFNSKWDFVGLHKGAHNVSHAVQIGEATLILNGGFYVNKLLDELDRYAEDKKCTPERRELLNEVLPAELQSKLPDLSTAASAGSAAGVAGAAGAAGTAGAAGAAPIAAPPKCPDCGRIVERPNSKFCTGCGFSFSITPSAAKEPARSVQPPTPPVVPVAVGGGGAVGAPTVLARLATAMRYEDDDVINAFRKHEVDVKGLAGLNDDQLKEMLTDAGLIVDDISAVRAVLNTE